MSSTKTATADEIRAQIKAKQDQAETLRKEIATLRDRLQAMQGDLRREDANARLQSAKEKAEARQAKIEQSIGDCFCGCGIPHAPGKRFLQGHDARFWGMVQRIRDGKETETEHTPERVKQAIKEGWQKGGNYGKS